MLDEKQKCILSYILSECKDNYKVIEVEDFEDYFKSKLPNKKLNLNNILTHLQNNNYIIIKYFDDNKYCLCATALSKQILNQESQEKTKLKKIKFDIILVLILIFIFAFIGSFLGTLIYNLIL